jgi:hypothetical protein
VADEAEEIAARGDSLGEILKRGVNLPSQEMEGLNATQAKCQPVS